MIEPPFAPIPESIRPLYIKLRIALFAVFLFSGAALAYGFLFPTITTGFDFRNPKSSKNQIFDPRGADGSIKTNGKIGLDERLVANTSPLGDFSVLSVGLDLEKKSATPSSLQATVRRNYRAYLFPLGAPIEGFGTSSLFRVEDTYYELRDGVLHPFVSEGAFLSRFPLNAATVESRDWRGRYTLSNELVGFRIGSLVSFADGIYVITSERDMRPIGSAEIFLALGYRFEDVIPGSAEDLGIYKRGRIFLTGAPHPDGTLFRDRDTGEHFLIDAGFRRSVSAGAYLDFLLSQIHPVIAATPHPSEEATCSAEAGLLPRALDCTIDLAPLSHSIGSDYEVTLSGNDTPIDIAALTLSFETRLNAENGARLLSKVKDRFLTRFGLK